MGVAGADPEGVQGLRNPSFELIHLQNARKTHQMSFSFQNSPKEHAPDPLFRNPGSAPAWEPTEFPLIFCSTVSRVFDVFSSNVVA